MNRSTPTVAIALLCLAAAPALAQHDHKILGVGHDDSNILHFHSHDAMPFDMGPSAFQGIDGFATAEVAFESIADHPGIGLFALDPSSNIRAVLVAADAGIQIFGGIDPLPIGGELVLGNPFFHIIPIFNIFHGEIGHEYSLRMKFHDASGLYHDSDEFNIRFVAVPAPAAALPLLGLVSLRRSRR